MKNRSDDTIRNILTLFTQFLERFKIDRLLTLITISIITIGNRVVIAQSSSIVLDDQPRDSVLNVVFSYYIILCNEEKSMHVLECPTSNNLCIAI